MSVANDLYKHQVDPNSVPTHTFDWALIKWFVTPELTGGAITFGEVMLLPGKGHVRHNHPEKEEILYVISGEGEQMLDDGPYFPIKAGDTIYIPTAVYHATRSASWEPLRLLAIYTGGPEPMREVPPDFKEVPAGQLPAVRPV